jgi:hypothetical protein
MNIRRITKLNSVINVIEKARLAGNVDVYDHKVIFFDDLSNEAVGQITFDYEHEEFSMDEFNTDPLVSRFRDMCRVVKALRKEAFKNYWCEFRCVKRLIDGIGYDMVSGEVEILNGKGVVKNALRSIKDDEGERELPISDDELIKFIEENKEYADICENIGLLVDVLTLGDFDLSKWYFDGDKLFPRELEGYHYRCGVVTRPLNPVTLIQTENGTFLMERAVQYCKDLGCYSGFWEENARRYLKDHAREYPGKKFRILSQDFFGIKCQTYDL